MTEPDLTSERRWPTMHRLVRDLEAAGAPPEMIDKARNGGYDDYHPNASAFAMMELHRDLKAAGLDHMAAMVEDGKWDATKAESDAWAKSTEGQETMSDLIKPQPASGTRGDRILLGRFLAAVKQLERTGISQFEIAHDDDLPEGSPAKVLWWAGGNWKGHRVFSEHFSYPAQAAEDLLSRVVNGGRCTKCKRQTIVGVEVEGLCSRILFASDVDDEKSYVYVRECDT